jgi:2-beta-glucuronyltransferase
MIHEQVSGARDRQRVVLISGYHDYRTPKRASIHQIADGLVRCGLSVAFISTRFSNLSRTKGDSRLPLWNKANRVEKVNEIECLLWRTGLHPFRAGIRAWDNLMGRLFPVYASLPNEDFDRIVSEADYIVIELGIPVIYLRRIQSLNRQAKVVCYCADRLDTVGSHPFVRNRLVEDQHLVSHFILRSPAMAEYLECASGRLFHAGFGIDHGQFGSVGPSPYAAGSQTAVSVGSMLFDHSFFAAAGPAFPKLQFHVIGSGTRFKPTPNVHVHPEMPFASTLPFVKHASIGIAAYRPAPAAEYLADTSLKLAQFEYFGVPAVCPHFAVGSCPSRIGYEPGDEQSIRQAVEAALALAGRIEPRSFPDWSEVAMRVLEPRAYAAASIMQAHQQVS